MLIKIFLFVFPAALITAGCSSGNRDSEVAGPFTSDIESFSQYQYPEWFRDAKFGIWAHWGPQAVPRQGDWYARLLYQEGGR